nr:hypothetical protein GCM10020092_058150 [Actinoplanes digitatis]
MSWLSEQGALDLGQHGVVVADDAGEARHAPAQAVEQVVAQLRLHGAEDVAARAERAEGARKIGRRCGYELCGSFGHFGNATPRPVTSDGGRVQPRRIGSGPPPPSPER